MTRSRPRSGSSATEKPPRAEDRSLATVTDPRTRPTKSTEHRKDRSRAVAELRQDIEREHNACQAAAASAVLHAVAAGNALNAAKTLVGHGEFSRWLEEYFEERTGLTERTAQRYMQLAKHSILLADHARHELATNDPISASLVTDEQLLETYTINRALRTIASNQPPRNATPKVQAAHQTVVRHNEWLSPVDIVDAAVRFLGTIDVDPCAATGYTNIPATFRHTVEDDGLAGNCVWDGRAFVNPGQHGDIGPWVHRACQFFTQGSLLRAVLVLPAVTDALWSPLLTAFPRAFCRTRPTVECCRREAKGVGSLPQPVMIVALAQPDAYAEFVEAFCAIADVFTPSGMA